MKKNPIEAFVEYLRRLFYLFGVVLIGGVAAGCATPEPVVTVRYVVAAPPDNLIVDCRVEAPPSKVTYLRRDDKLLLIPDLSIASEPYPYTAEYIKVLMQTASDREAMLAALVMKHYQHADACNKRLKQLREWKVKTLLELNQTKKE